MHKLTPRPLQLISLGRQSGMTTLVIALLLLAILSIVLLFGTSVGLFEQRTVTNDTRGRLIQHAAEANLSVATEYIKANANLITSRAEGTGWLSATFANRWQDCTSSIPACLADPTDRDGQNMLYIDNMQTRMADLGAILASEGLRLVGGGTAAGSGFTVDQRQVHALLCVMPPFDPALPVGTMRDCLPTAPILADGTPPGAQLAVTLIAAAGISGENAFAVVKHSIATFRTIPGPPNVPIIAAGSINVAGNATIVPNPNGGGPGIPLSVWTNQNFQSQGSGGSFETCHVGDWWSNPGGGGGEGPRRDGETGAWLCETCSCQGMQAGKGAITLKVAGGGVGAAFVEGIDILDVDGNTEGELPDNTYFPSPPLDDPNNPLDDNLFEYIFGVDVVDVVGGVAVAKPANSAGDKPDVAFLKTNAVRLTCAEATSARFAEGGFFWLPEGCTVTGQVGSAAFPVVLVFDGALQANNAVIYGLIFIRGNGTCQGDSQFCATGNVTIYGSVAAEGNVRMRGSGTVVYSEAVLQGITTSNTFLRFGPIPGTWSDRHTADQFGLGN